MLAAGMLLAGCAASRNAPHFTIAVTHRVFPDYYEEVRTRSQKKFLIADKEYEGRIVRYVPDFYIDLETREIESRSDVPNNPAVQIFVYKDGKKVDEVWAFVKGKGAPHYSKKSLLAFEIIPTEAEPQPNEQ